MPSENPEENGEPSIDRPAPKLTKADEQRYTQLYKREWRQLRRWIEKGEKNNDPCPLHDPEKMLNWWPRNNTWRVPAEIEAAAVAASNGSFPVPALIPAGAPPSVAAPPTLAKAPLVPVTPIDLENFDPEEGDRLRELKQIQAAKFAHLKAALAAGHDCTALEGKYLKLCETIDKIESRVTERLKKRGLYILRDTVNRDLVANAELIRASHDSMERRVLELCPSLSSEQRAEVSAAIARAREAEVRMLSRLESLTRDDVLRELAA